MSSTKQFTLPEYQKLMKRLVRERGFDKETVPAVFMLLAEEVGELAKAIRKINGQKTSADSKTHIVQEEVADVFWLLIDLCNRLGIDLEKAFQRRKTKTSIGNGLRHG